MKKRGREAPSSRSTPGRLGVIALAAMLLVPALALWTPAPASAQGANAPWWGPNDKQDPTAGWGFRVPVTVRNPFEYPIDEWPVSVELHIGELLREAGWTTQNGRPQNFVLDVDSLRVIEYREAYTSIGRDGEPVPHVFHPARLETPSGGLRFNAENPAGTVTWMLTEQLGVGATRNYYIYFHSKLYDDREPYEAPEADRAALDNLHGGGRGTTFYGFEHGAQGQANTVEVIGLHDDTAVYFYTYTAGAPTLHTAQTDFKNPLPLNNTEIKRYVLPRSSFFKIEATKPILVSTHGQFASTPGDALGSYGSGFYVPSTDGGLRGTTFLVPAYAPHIWVVNKDKEAANVRMMSVVSIGRTESGTATVGHTNPIARITDDDGIPVIRGMVGSNPQRTEISWYRLSASEPFMVHVAGAMVPGTHSVPTAYGGSHGTEFYTVLPQKANDPTGTTHDGVYEVGSFEEANLRLRDPRDPGRSVFPRGASFGDTPPHMVEPGVENFKRFKTNETIPTEQSLWFWSSGEPQYLPDTGRGDVFVSAGRGPRVGHYLGHAASEYVAHDPSAIFGYHNETRIHVLSVTAETCWWEGRCPQKAPTASAYDHDNITLMQDGVAELRNPDARPSEETRYLITSDKPVAVVSRAETDYYGRFVPGRLPNPDFSVGALEFRGPLMQLTSAGQGTQTILAADTGPGNPVEFKLRVRNLGQWIGGADLPDSFELTCDTDQDGWIIEGCDKRLGPLASHEGEAFSVFVTPPEDADAGDRAQILVRTKSGHADMSASLNLYVTVRVEFGAGIWFDAVNGLPSKTIYHDLGVSENSTLVVKNLGSVRDTITVEVDTKPAWNARLIRSDTGESATALDLTLDPDEAMELRLVTTPPSGEGFPFAGYTVTASASAGPVGSVRANAQLKADLDFFAELDRATKVGNPGESVLFNVSVVNQGGDFLHFEFDVDNSSIPANWTARFSETAIDNDANFTVQLNVTVPPGALAGELASLKLAITASDGAAQGKTLPAEARVLVRHLHNVTYSASDVLPVRPGSTLEHVLTLTNGGNGLEEIEVLRSSVRPFWPVASGLPRNLILPRDETAQLPVVVDVPPGTPPGRVDLTFDLRLNREADTPVILPLNVLTVRDLELEPRTTLQVTPGQEFTFEVEATNRGNVNGTYTLEADAPPGWNASFAPRELALAPGDSRIVTLRVNATRDASESTFPLTLRAVTEGANAQPTETEVNVTVAKPTLAVGEAISPGQPRRGELYVVRVPVSNAGDIDAVNVRVALRVDGKDVDVVTLGRIPAGEEMFATLKWEVDHSPDTMEVVVNPDGGVVTSDGQPVTAFVSVEKGIPAPGLLPATLALAGAALVIAHRRRFQA